MAPNCFNTYKVKPHLFICESKQTCPVKKRKKCSVCQHKYFFVSVRNMNSDPACDSIEICFHCKKVCADRGWKVSLTGMKWKGKWRPYEQVWPKRKVHNDR